MLFLITAIEFDFDGDEDFAEQFESKLTNEIIGTEWIVDDEDDLVDEISDVTGWCIKSIQYEQLVCDGSESVY